MIRGLLLFSFATVLALTKVAAQDEIRLRDSQEVQLLAQRKVEKGLNDLLNTITFEDLGEFERKAIINDSYGNSPNKIFFDDQVIIEDDLNPEHTTSKNSIDLPVGKYLANFELFYPKSTDYTILFSDFKVSKLKKSDYYYVKVYFKSQFKGQHKQIGQAYKQHNRVAEVRAEKKGKKWSTYITRVAFVGTEDSNEDTSNDVELVADSPVASNQQVEESLNEADIAREKERELERLALEEYNKWLDLGDKALAARDYDKALEAYTEAEKRNDFDDLLPRRKIYQVKRAFEKEKQTQNELLREYLIKGSIAQKKRNYTEAIGFYNKAFELKPDSVALGETIKILNQKSRIKTELDEKYIAGRYSEVIKDYSRILKNEKDNSDYFLGRGLAYARTNDLDRAIKDYNQAIELDYANLAALSARAELHVFRNNNPKAIADLTSYLNIDNTATEILTRRAELRILTKNTSGAFEDFTRAIELDSKNAVLYYSRGMLAFQTGDYSGAVADYSKAISINSKYADAYYHRGLSYIKSKEVVKAGKDFQDLRKLSINSQQEEQIALIANQYLDVALATFNKKDYSQAIKEFDSVIHIRPATAEAWFYRANCFQNSRDTLSAISSYDSAISYRESYVDALFERGQLLYSMKKYNAAATDFQKAFKIMPTLFKALAGEGDALFAQDLFDKVIPVFEFIKANEKRIGSSLSAWEFAEAYHKLGIAYFRTQQPTKAIDEYDRAINKLDNFSDAYYNRGLAYESIGNLRRAISDHRKSVELDAINPRKYLSLGFALAKDENYQESILSFSEAIKRDKDNTCCLSVGMLNRANSFYLLKQYEKAVNDYTTVLELDSASLTPQAALNTGIGFLYLKQPEKAVRYLSLVKAGDVLIAESLFGVGCALVQLNKQEEALKAFLKAFQTGHITRSYLRKNTLLTISDKSFEKRPDYKELVNRYAK
jgi:tetratricopeptide (TPR) repeat protein